MRHAPTPGMTIVELMIALVLGLVVILLAGSMFMTANAGFSAQREQAAVDDAGRFALAGIERAVRQAGYIDLEMRPGAAWRSEAPAFIDGFDAASISKSSDGIGGPRPAVANGSDVLALRFGGAGAAPDGDGSMLDCAGFPIHAQREGWSIFYVALSAGGVPELRCKYKGDDNWGADAVVAGVDSFQVLYGLDSDVAPDGRPDQFVTAATLHALDSELVPEGATEIEQERDRNRKTHWKRVTSIKVALVLHGSERSRHLGKPAVFDLFGPAYSEAAGASDEGVRIDEAAMAPSLRERERSSFSSTIMLRNPAN